MKVGERKEYETEALKINIKRKIKGKKIISCKNR